MRSSTSAIFAAAAIIAPAFAQTSTKCDPTKQSCPADPALGKAVFYDFTKGSSSDFTVSEGSAPTFDSNGATFSISQKLQGPTMYSSWYMMFGHYDIVMQPASGAGIVSSIVLQSDDLDEIDLEWIGNQQDTVQSNYYGKGNTATYDRGQNLTASGMFTGFHTYSVDWTAEQLTWSIDGEVKRTLTPATADQTPFNQYPQSPMQLRIGNWDAGDSPQSGTSTWAGGPPDFSQGPFKMIVKSIRAVDYSTGTQYTYNQGDGTWQTINSVGGKINPSGAVDDAAVSTAAPGAASSSSLSMAGGVIGTAATNTASNTATAPVATGTVSSPSGASPSGSSAGTSGTPTRAATSTTPTSGANSLNGAASIGLLAAIAAALAL